MEQSSSNESSGGRPKRVFLRVPVKLAVEILLDGGKSMVAQIEDLSTRGLAFYLKDPDQVPDIFNISLRITPASKPLNLQLEVKSRTAVIGGVRIGCIFSTISEEDKHAINKYICELIDFPKHFIIINLAAFLCLLDSAWRIIAYFLYYEARNFERVFKAPVSYQLYFFVLLFYAGSSYIAYSFNTRVTSKEEKSRFCLAFFGLAASFVFVTVKAFGYWASFIFAPKYIPTTLFIAGYTLFLIYMGFSIRIANSIFRNPQVAGGSIKQHWQFIFNSR